MPHTSLLLPAQHTPLATLVVAVVTAVAIMAASLIVISEAPDAPVPPRPAATRMVCDAIPGGLQCRAAS